MNSVKVALGSSRMTVEDALYARNRMERRALAHMLVIEFYAATLICSCVI